MVKLYYTPTSCGASSFICSHIKGLKMDCEVVDLMTHITESGVDFYKINPKGNVPTIVLDDGTVLNENITCLEYIADQTIGPSLAPDKDSNERYKLMQILSFLSSELHSSIGLLFNPNSKEGQIRKFVKSVFDKKMQYLQKHIIKGDYIYGNQFTIIDAYLHIILSWCGYVNINLSEYPIAYKYFNGIIDLPFVKEAKQRMATIPSTIC